MPPLFLRFYALSWLLTINKGLPRLNRIAPLPFGNPAILDYRLILRSVVLRPNLSASLPFSKFLIFFLNSESIFSIRVKLPIDNMVFLSNFVKIMFFYYYYPKKVSLSSWKHNQPLYCYPLKGLRLKSKLLPNR